MLLYPNIWKTITLRQFGVCYLDSVVIYHMKLYLLYLLYAAAKKILENTNHVLSNQPVTVWPFCKYSIFSRRKEELYMQYFVTCKKVKHFLFSILASSWVWCESDWSQQGFGWLSMFQCCGAREYTWPYYPRLPCAFSRQLLQSFWR